MKIAIVCIFFDGYSDLWKDFINLKSLFWNSCTYPMYIVNNSKEIEYSSEGSEIRVLHAGNDAEYSKKVQVALAEIDADYYLMLLDDFFFTKKLDGSILDSVVDYMKKNSLEYYEMPMPGFRSLKVSRGKIKSLVDRRGYTVSCMPAIWSKSFLKKCIGNGNYNAWIFEGIYANAEFADKNEFKQKCVIDYGNPLNLCHGALQGKILPSAKKKLRRCGYCITSPRPELSFVQASKYKLKTICRKLIPSRLLPVARKILHTSSIFDKYSTEIKMQISEMENDW